MTTQSLPPGCPRCLPSRVPHSWCRVCTLRQWHPCYPRTSDQNLMRPHSHTQDVLFVHLVFAPADALVRRRLLELLDIICNRLATSGGLLASTYTPAPNGGTWRQAPGSDVNYGAGVCCPAQPL